MSNNRYIEVDSTYRDRNMFPLASNFEMQISQSGNKSGAQAIDPVCLSAPIRRWRSNAFDSTAAAATLTASITNVGTLSTTSEASTYIIKTAAPVTLQTTENYYVGAVLQGTFNATIARRRITSYKYLGLDSAGDTMAEITLDSNPPEWSVLPIAITIYDPTDITSNPDFFFIPEGSGANNAYPNMFLYNETRSQLNGVAEFVDITDYNGTTHIATVDNVPGGWLTTDIYSIRTENPSVFLMPVPVVGGTTPPVNTATVMYFLPANRPTCFPAIEACTQPPPAPDNTYAPNQKVSQDLVGSFLRILPGSTVFPAIFSEPPTDVPVSRIIDYRRVPATYTAAGALIYPEHYQLTYSAGIGVVAGSETTELLTFSYDNMNPFNYTGSMVSQQEEVCYEISLLNLVLPNQVLNCGAGGRTSFYQYFYVELSNVSSSGGRNRNVIYSNNPNSSLALFRASVDDIPNLINSSFIKIDGDSATQTVKFKPNDNLRFSVRLSDGESFQTVLEEKFSPERPNPLAQISALFSIKRL